MKKQQGHKFEGTEWGKECDGLPKGNFYPRFSRVGSHSGTQEKISDECPSLVG
jgi:hypothetical protein